MNEPLVYVIILLYNGKQWIKDCLRTVLKTDYGNLKVLVVDNASKDEGLSEVKKEFPEVEVIRNDRNYGLGEGNNKGIRYVLKKGAEFVMLLNQDTKVDPGWIQGQIEIAFMEKDMGVGISFQYDYEGVELDKNFEKCLGEKACSKDIYIPVDHLIGAAMFFRSSALASVGLFDPGYFIYFDESDLFRRMQYHGYKVGAVPGSKIMHWDSWIHKDKLSGRMKTLFLNNELIFFLKNPARSVWANIGGYIRFKYDMMKKAHGPWKGVLSLCKNMALRVSAFRWIPQAMEKRRKETGYPCYLNEEDDY